MFKELAGLRERYGVTGALYAFRLPECKKFYLARWLFAVAAASGQYKPGMPVAEITAGNMGLALAEQCEKYRSPLYLVPIGRLSEEKRRALEEKGARLVDARPKEGVAAVIVRRRLPCQLRVAGLAGHGAKAARRPGGSTTTSPRYSRRSRASWAA